MTPKIIHQTWKSTRVPDHLMEYQASWRRFHPDWTYRLWTDEDNWQLVCDRYPNLREFYERLPYPILKVEFMKLLYLDSFGGLYVDLDFEALRPLDDVLKDDHIIMGREIGGIGGMTRGREYIMNALIWSPAGHPFWKQVLEEAVSQFRSKRPWELYEIYIIDRVIDIIDRKAIEYCKQHHDMVILGHEPFYPSPQSERDPEARRDQGRRLGSYAVHHYDDSWFSTTMKIVTKLRYGVSRLLRRSPS